MILPFIPDTLTRQIECPMRRTSWHTRRPTRREFLVGAAAIAAAALLVDGTEVNRHHLTVLEHTATIANLPPAFHGFRIAQISDFHHRGFDEDFFLRRVVRRVNALAPDMVALTGDFITADARHWKRNQQHAHICAEILRNLVCPLRFCSLGNHDSIDKRGVIAALKQNGLPVLDNKYESLERGGDRLWISGIADSYFDAPDLSRAIPLKRSGAPVVLLGHEPDFADVVAEYGGVDLMLAGHTHGGQVRIPLLMPMFLPDLGRKYIHGPFQLQRLQLYVNRGIGTVHMPVRFRCPPEITVLTLQPA